MISEYFDSFSFYCDSYSTRLLQQFHQWGNLIISFNIATEAKLFRRLNLIDYIHIIPSGKSFHDVVQSLVLEIDLSMYP